MEMSRRAASAATYIELNLDEFGATDVTPPRLTAFS
jgi:hypothetical protein